MDALLKTFSGICCALVLLAACGGAVDGPSTPHYAADVVAGTQVPSAATGYHDVVQRIYVAYFGRPADPAGLSYWANQYLEAGMPTDMAEITAAYGTNAAVRTFVDVFGSSQESRDLYPGDNDSFITAIYHNIFSRNPDSAGKAFWVNALDAGLMTRAMAAISLMAGARSTDITVINKKINAATMFTNALNTPRRLEAYSGLTANAVLRTMLGNVNLTTNPATFGATIDATLASLVAGGSGVQYFGFFYGPVTADGRVKVGLIPATGGTAVPALSSALVVPTGIFAQATVSNGTISNGHLHSLLVWKDLNLYRQELLDTSGALGNAQVSTLLATDVCDLGFSGVDPSGFDAVDASRSWTLFRTRGVDQQCNTKDDGHVGVRMNMSANDAPRSIGEPVAAIHASNLALEGWLVRSGQTIMRVNSEFENPVAMFTLPGDDLHVIDSVDSASNLFIFSSGKALYSWNTGASAGSPSLITAFAEDESVDRLDAIDDKSVFILIGNSTGRTRVVRYDVATKITSPIGSVSDFANGNPEMALTPTRVILRDPFTGTVVALPRSGGIPTTIYTQAEGAGLTDITIAGERIWIVSLFDSIISLNSDGSNVQIISNSTFAGCLRKPIVNYGSDSSDCDAVLIVQNGILRSFDAVSAVLRVTYGSVPVSPLSRTNFFSVTYSEWGQGAILTQASAPDDLGSTTIVNYYFDSDREGITPIVVQ